MHLIPSGNLGLFFQVNKVRSFAKELGIDIIHAHLPWAGIMARFVGNKLNIPIVYTEHNTWERYNKVSYWGNRVSFKNQDIAIAVSNEVALSMQLNSMLNPYKRGGRMKIKVIQNGVNTDVFRRSTSLPLSVMPGSRESGEAISIIGTENREQRIENEIIGGSPNRSVSQSLNLPTSSKIIGIVAVFRDQKRLWIWIDLALKILHKCPETHFVLVGDGEWRTRLERQIEESGKSRNFHLVGVQKQVIPYLSIMDIYLSTSEFEGLPIAMLEAMSCEVPVVATRAGGIGEVIQHGVQGFLSEIEEYEELVDYCVQLIHNLKLHQSMSIAARQRVVDQFSMNRMVEELEGVYETVIGKSVGL